MRQHKIVFLGSFNKFVVFIYTSSLSRFSLMSLVSLHVAMLLKFKITVILNGKTFKAQGDAWFLHQKMW